MFSSNHCFRFSYWSKKNTYDWSILLKTQRIQQRDIKKILIQLFRTTLYYFSRTLLCILCKIYDEKIISSNCYIQNYTLNKNGSKFISISSYKEVEENPNVSTLIFKLTIYGVLCWQMLVHTKSYCEKVKLNWKILSMWHEPKSFQGKQMLKSSIFEGNIIKQPHIKFLVFTCTTCKKNIYNRYDIPVYAAVIWLKYCWYDIKTIDQSRNIVDIEQVEGGGGSRGEKVNSTKR